MNSRRLQDANEEEVDRTLEEPLSDIVIDHLRAVREVSLRNYVEAYTHQVSAGIAFIFFFLSHGMALIFLLCPSFFSQSKISANCYRPRRMRTGPFQ